MPASVYILICADGSLYTGATLDLEKRIATHNRGKASKYTRGRLPVRLAFHKTFPDMREALRAEHRIKQWTRTKKQALLEGKIGLTGEPADS